MRKTSKEAWKGSRADYDAVKPMLSEMGIEISYDQWVKAGNSRPDLLIAMGDVERSTRIIEERARSLVEAIVLLSSPQPSVRGQWTEAIVQHIYELVADAGRWVDRMDELGRRGSALDNARHPPP